MDPLEHFSHYLKQSSFLTEEDCDLFRPSLNIKQIPAKEHFLLENQICHELAFVHKGGFRTYYLQDGKEINTRFSFEDQFVVDYDSFLNIHPGRYFIQALEDSTIVTFNLNSLTNAYHASKNWERFGRIIAESAFKETTQRVESFLFMSGEQRYTHLLETEPSLFERIPLYHIASYLGIERESLSRLRKKIATKDRM